MNKTTIDALRKYLDLPTDVSDDEIVEHCQGTLLEARINLHIAMTNLIRCFK